MKATIKSNVLLAAAMFCSKDESRPILTGVHMKVEDGAITIAATDAFRLVEMTQDGGEEDGEATFQIGKLPKNRVVVIEGNDEEVTLDILGDSKTTTKSIEGHFPKYKSLFPDGMAAPLTHIGFNAEYVNNVQKAYRLMSGKKDATLTMEFTGDKKPLCFMAEHFRAIVMPTYGAKPTLEQPPESDNELRAEIDRLEAELKEKSEAIESLEAELKDKDYTIAKCSTVVDEVKHEDITEPAGKGKTPQERDEAKAKVDALIAEFGAIQVAGETTCAIYLSGIEKDTPEMEAVKAAGGKWGNHKKFGKCWYMSK